MHGFIKLQLLQLCQKYDICRYGQYIICFELDGYDMKQAKNEFDKQPKELLASTKHEPTQFICTNKITF